MKAGGNNHDDLGTRGVAAALQFAALTAGLSLFIIVPLLAVAWTIYGGGHIGKWLMPMSIALILHSVPPLADLVFSLISPPWVKAAFDYMAQHHGLLVVSWIVAGGLAACVGGYVYLSFRVKQRQAEIQTVGLPVFRDPKLALRAFVAGLKDADGVHIHPKIRIRKSDESEHILVAGSTGAGKTQAMDHMIRDAIARRDALILQDVKGDQAARFAGQSLREAWQNRVVLLAPWDSRSVRWDIASDIETPEDARLLASIFIPLPKSGNPFFAQASRRILSATMTKLADTRGDGWCWSDLWDLLRDPRRLVPFLQGTEAASALQFIPDSDSLDRESKSVYNTLQNDVEFVGRLARAWPKSRHGVSIRFLIDKVNSTGWKVILGWRADWEPVSGPLASGFYSLFISRFLSAGEGYFKRPVWLVLDEFSALPKISGIPNFLRLARSYGGRMIVGIQDIAGVRERYGRDESESILNNFGVRIIGRLEDSSTAKWAAESFGQVRTKERVISMQEGGRVDAGLADDGLTRSYSWQEKDKAALVSSDFLHLPKATKDGFFAWVKVSATDGARLMGKIHYPISPIEKPFPSCIPVSVKSAKAKPKPSKKAQVEAKRAEPSAPKPEKPATSAAGGGAGGQAQQQPVKVEPEKKQEPAREQKPVEPVEQQVGPVQQAQPEPEPEQPQAQQAEKQAERLEQVDPVKEIASEALEMGAEAALRQSGADQLADAMEAASTVKDISVALDVTKQAQREATPAAPAPQAPRKQEQQHDDLLDLLLGGDDE